MPVTRESIGAVPRQKERVHEFWNQHSCGEGDALGSELRERLVSQARRRYELEPYLPPFARFADGKGKDVLEVGVGMGADHLEWAKSGPRLLKGVDLTERAVNFTTQRLQMWGFTPQVRTADAENLPFDDASFDIVYSWGVLLCAPDVQRAIREVHRVLRPGGIARIMLYHKYCVVGFGLWLRYALFTGRPWRSLDDVYAHHLESPGTKCHSLKEARALFTDFARADFRIQQSHADFMQGNIGRQHRGPLLTVTKALWPTWLVKRCFKRFGALILIEAVK